MCVPTHMIFLHKYLPHSIPDNDTLLFQAQVLEHRQFGMRGTLATTCQSFI